MSKPTSLATHRIDSRTLTIRAQRVIIDADLTELYGVPTKRLNEEAKRNLAKFPTDFMLELTNEEWDFLGSQFGILNASPDSAVAVTHRMCSPSMAQSRRHVS